jgi:chromosome segregation ATPase
MNKTISTLQERITKLVNENTSMEGEIQSTQENLRISTNQNQKIMQELQQYKKLIEQNDQESQQNKMKIQKLLGENSALGEEVRGTQENLRLSAGTIAKLRAELEDYRNKITNNDQENNSLKIKMQKILSENVALGD